MSRINLLIAITLIIVLPACIPAGQTNAPETMDTPAPPTMPAPPITATDPASVVIAFYGSLNGKNLDAAMEYLADSPEICYPPDCLTNKDQVRAFWEKEFANGYLPYVSIITVEGKEVTYSWTAVHNGRAELYGTGKIIVENGKIISDK